MVIIHGHSRSSEILSGQNNVFRRRTDVLVGRFGFSSSSKRYLAVSDGLGSHVPAISHSLPLTSRRNDIDNPFLAFFASVPCESFDQVRLWRNLLKIRRIFHIYDFRSLRSRISLASELTNGRKSEKHRNHTVTNGEVDISPAVAVKLIVSRLRHLLPPPRNSKPPWP